MTAPGDVNGSDSELYHHYGQVVRRLLAARWRETPLLPDVDDATQEVFVECLKPDGPLQRVEAERGGMSAMLFGVTRNVARRFEERAGKRKQLAQQMDTVLGEIAARESNLSVVFDREWARALVRRAGDRMRAVAERGSPGKRLRAEVLRLRFSEGLPIREIAAQWEVDADSVHRAYAKARDEFREHLRRIVAEDTVRAEEDLDDEVTRILGLLR